MSRKHNEIKARVLEEQMSSDPLHKENKRKERIKELE